MKTEKLFTILCIILLSLPLVLAALEAPHAFYGTATINGRDLPLNSVIVAKIDDAEVGRFTVTTAGKYGEDVNYRMFVDKGNSTTIIFYAQTPQMENYVAATQTAEWQSGAVTELNLVFTGDEVLIPVPPTPPATGGSSGGSGGGGGGGSAPKADQKTQVFSNLQPGKPGIIQITNNNFTVTLVQFYVTADIPTAEMTVKQLTDKPADVSDVQNAYDYFEITPNNIADTQLNTSYIKFHVPISWFTGGNYDRESVKLLRYHDGAWQELKTSYINEDGTYYNFAAETPGFSVFTITAQAVRQAVTQKEEVKTTTETPQNKTEQTAEQTTAALGGETQTVKEVKQQKSPSSLFIGIIIVLAIIIIAMAVYLITIKKK